MLGLESFGCGKLPTGGSRKLFVCVCVNACWRVRACVFRIFFLNELFFRAV